MALTLVAVLAAAQDVEPPASDETRAVSDAMVAHLDQVLAALEA